MMGATFILIIVLFAQSTASTAALTSVTHEFFTRQSCEDALAKLQSSITGVNARIISQGCYKK